MSKSNKRHRRISARGVSVASVVVSIIAVFLVLGAGVLLLLPAT